MFFLLSMDTGDGVSTLTQQAKTPRTEQRPALRLEPL
jgi:hypothetical protein